MKLESHVINAINSMMRKNEEEALMHACFAIDGTAKKLYLKKQAGRIDYVRCIRDYYWLIEYFIGGAVDIVNTHFTHLKLLKKDGRKIKNPDLADFIYQIYRCNSAHGEEIPLKYQLIPSNPNRAIWIIDTKNHSLQIPSTIIWALLATSVFSSANSDIFTATDHYLTYENQFLCYKYLIKDFWGKENIVRHDLVQFSLNRVIVRNL